MNSKQNILKTLGANETKIKSFGVRSLSLFGSSARDQDSPASDLDFVVEFERKSFDAYMDLKFFLEDLFGKPVDLVLADGIKPRLRSVILREAILPRDFEVYLEDIRQAIGKIRSYTEGLTRDSFDRDDKTIDAVIRNLEIIGEAAKMVPESVRANYLSVEWKKIAGLRDILAHQYFEVDLDIIWDILTNKLPELERQINAF